MALQADPWSTSSSPLDRYPGGDLSKHEPQIRLLEILPGKRDDEVRCNLRCVNFKAIKEADALSYAWGHLPATSTIFVNDAIFEVRKNLFDALVHMRQPYSPTILWIDAICINQSDINERNHQVQQMADLFSLARRVLVWLGLETENTQEAFSFLSNSYLHSPSNRREVMDDPRWAALKELCEMEYWNRVWIVQEICLASRVVICCGRQQIPWKYISELRKARKHIWPQYHSSGERDFMRSLPARLDQQKEARLNGGCTLWTLLENFKDSLCQDVHDKIYGFMGLLTDCGSRGLTIDYAKPVGQLYRDVIWFYHNKFEEDSSLHHSAQLMKLSEFLQDLFCSHSEFDKRAQKSALYQQSICTLRGQLEDSRPAQSIFVSISACDVMAITRFPDSDHPQAKEYRVSELIDFLKGKIPYSHLGYWRDMVESNLAGVNTVNDSQAYTTVKYNEYQRPPLVQKINRPSVFIAARMNNGYADYQQSCVVGIAPAGSQTGDLVLSFVESQVALVMRDPTYKYDAPPEFGHELKISTQKLIGRGCVFSSHMQKKVQFKTQLTRDKAIEIIWLTSHDAKSVVPKDPFPAILSIDLSTLQIVTKPSTNHLASGFNRPALEWFPSESSKPHIKDVYAHRLNKALDDSEFQKMQENLELRRYALGPGYTAITNPGSIGYVVSALQILYMLKPFRTAVLRAEPTPDQKLLTELQNLFWKLHNSTLPVSPLGLTDAFGWERQQLNEAQDFFEFWIVFLERIGNTALGKESTAFMVGEVKTFYSESGSQRDEFFYNLQVSAAPNSKRLEDSLAEYCGIPGPQDISRTFKQLQQVLILNTKFFQMDLKTYSIVIDTGTFEYPSEVDLARYTDPNITDTVYQLHGVVVLEDVKPTPRYLLYLRPRLEDQWILFFKETVSNAQRSEVFEDNFRGNNHKTLNNAPLRTPYVLVYIQKSRLNELLG
ncbi:hypothetical protein B0O99DRAFT_553461 [Bisporella sp. PMI_857]|nr:hypothetical protein B0O99DRAFT_553461 [Bisporella sp. PMI_857]